MGHSHHNVDNMFHHGYTQVPCWLVFYSTSGVHGIWVYQANPEHTVVSTYVAIGRYRWFAWAIVVGIGVSVLMVHGRWTEVA